MRKKLRRRVRLKIRVRRQVGLNIGAELDRPRAVAVLQYQRSARRTGRLEYDAHESLQQSALVALRREGAHSLEHAQRIERWRHARARGWT
jgi:hypothetical protein